MHMENDVKKDMSDSIEHLKSELKHLRTSRANPAMLDAVKVEVYGAMMRLKDVSNVTTPESRQILISPFDAKNVQAIAKAIENANLNLQPMVDGNVVRIQIPPMDESIRKETVKICKKKGEEAKISIREIRRKYNDRVRKEKAENNLTEDQVKRTEKKIQEFTDQFCKDIDQLCANKEKEILQI
jgi:ribosome recycling factor